MKIKLSVLAVLVLLIMSAGLRAQQPQDEKSIAVPNQTVPVKKVKETNKEDWTKTWSIVAAYSTTFDSNLDHEINPQKAFGFVPSVTAGYQMRSKRHRIRLIYGIAASRYTRSTDLNRVGQYFGGAYRLSFGRWSLETEGEAILKGTNEDRETNDQFVATEKLAYRFDRKTRATVYFAYRVKRYAPVDAERNAVNPMYGFKFSREFGRRIKWDLGYRYDENRAFSPRQNYIRSTYDTSVSYQLTKKDLISADMRFRPRLYERTINLGGGVRVPRHDRKYTFDFAWRRNVSDRFGFELIYGYEKQNSNDAEKLYRSHQAGFSLFYRWGNGEAIVP